MDSESNDSLRHAIITINDDYNGICDIDECWNQDRFQMNNNLMIIDLSLNLRKIVSISISKFMLSMNESQWRLVNLQSTHYLWFDIDMCEFWCFIIYNLERIKYWIISLIITMAHHQIHVSWVQTWMKIENILFADDNKFWAANWLVYGTTYHLWVLTRFDNNNLAAL